MLAHEKDEENAFRLHQFLDLGGLRDPGVYLTNFPQDGSSGIEGEGLWLGEGSEGSGFLGL
jgi:hypothetical protein